MSLFQCSSFIALKIPCKSSYTLKHHNGCTTNCSFLRMRGERRRGYSSLVTSVSIQPQNTQEDISIKDVVADGRSTSSTAATAAVESARGIGVVEFLQGKSFLITGATGFLAKVFIEKLLRAVPNVGKIYLLIKAKSKEAATDRLKTEIIDSELFKCVEQMHGKSYHAFMMSKLVPVVGDLCESNLGMDIDSADEIAKEVNVIVNSAANTTFDERYDVALDTNTKGPHRLMSFAKSCNKLKLFLHYSSAFANWESEGIILEKPFRMGASLAREGATSENPSSTFPLLDVDAEIKLALKSRENFPDIEVTQKMKELGLERARFYGWLSTYSFTKAMGEMIIHSMSGDIPVVIVRPTVIESSCKEPFPGWIQGNRVLDPLLISYGKGLLPGFLGDLQVHIDVVPVDMVVNATMAAIAKHGIEGKPKVNVYHIASDMVNPLLFHDVFEFSREHFISSPFMNKNGNTIGINEMKFFKSLDDFSEYLLDQIYTCWSGIAQQSGQIDATNLNQDDQKMLLLKKFKKNCEHVLNLAKTYESYVFYRGRFDSGNMQKLMEDMSEEETMNFIFDFGSINWKDYIKNIHIPGVRKHILKGRATF